MKQLINKCFLTMAVCFILTACNNDEGNNNNRDTADRAENNNQLESRDEDFIKEAYYDGLKEIELGRLAQQRGQSQDVKNLGRTMVEDHTAMGERLRSLARSKNITLRDSLETSDRDDIRNNRRTGRDFDRWYASEMVDSHEDAVKDYEDAAGDGRHPEVRALANEALPKLREHLERSRTVRDKVRS